MQQKIGTHGFDPYEMGVHLHRRGHVGKNHRGVGETPMGYNFVGDNPIFRQIVGLVPNKGRLSLENEQVRATISRRRDGSLVFETSERLHGSATLFAASDVVTFQAQTNPGGHLETLKITKGAFTTSPSPVLMGRIFVEKIAQPIARMLTDQTHG